MGFFFFQFENVAAMEEVIEGGPWLYLGQPIVLQKWEPGMVLRKLKHTEVPIWIKLRHLPVELWTTEGLSTVASGIGRPLYPDAITRACTRLDFARVCVMLNVNSKLPKHVVIMMPNELGEQELKLMEKVHAAPVSEEIHHHPEIDKVGEERPEHGRDKAIWNVRGLNRRDHQVAVRDLVNEFRLHFIALLETRVLQNNVTRIQSGLLSRWRWFVDYAGPGECKARIMAGAYRFGNNSWQRAMAGRRGFNAVLDLSEVSGASGDIRVAMNEFNDCILQTGLLPLPMQGERFTWHNCSLDGRSLWKKLDRLLVNDIWMERWPLLYYTCLTPRTSDHSPLVLKGDCRNMQVSLFRFDNYLALSPGFLASVHSIWRHPIVGDLAMNVKLAAGFLEVAQNILQYDRHNSLLLLLEHCCRLVYLKASKLEQIMLRQRAKLQWLKGGDQCSRIFFRRVATRRANKRVFQISDDDGNEQTDSNAYSHEDEARAIIRPVTNEEVKIAFFDIEEDKAPGPDGFSSGFFKAAWPVVGEEVRPLIQLQNSGLYLAATLCTKLLPRFLCALKVDLRKAYDTVEWDFLIATLQMFGFPATFIRWIEECVTSAHYSVVVNGGVHGFFAGARGLRQGDPMSPYLFVLVMEVLHMILQQLIEQDGEFRYHWRCQI
ncbi:UNVERIFIED_CONTAM: Transposon TX1 uncharacterized protein [Sesamum angustifolium]|uniref:Transposon TX1 uncharacterized protein n=1 Tax=Sesamum angustifolium TaxID=2727405 RepID=A0AAW2JHI0_9LAMI